MDDDDHDDLLQCTDDESLSETEDQCLPTNIDKPAADENDRNTLIYFSHTTIEFVTTKCLLIISATVVTILLPLYMESVNVRGDVYSMLSITSILCTLMCAFLIVLVRAFSPTFRCVRVHVPPLKFAKSLLLSAVYAASGLMVVYALDRKRVSCHLQDPIKGIVLVCSLLYYFFFCKKLMGLQRIFSATTIIVGLFIAVDYGLCDEFRCRGYEREKSVDDTGPWSWQTHSIWTTVYICGLAMFSGFFTLLDRLLLNGVEMEFQDASSTNMATSLLSTVSRSVSYPNNLTRARSTPVLYNKKYSVLHVTLWLHIFATTFIILLFWTDFIPSVGKSSNPSEFLNYTVSGLLCHFSLPVSEIVASQHCGNVSVYAWLFIGFYMVFIIAAIKLLMLTQSAVYTVATMTAALPLVGVWWSLFHMIPLDQGLLVWAPSVTGELICSLLGLPIILIGLVIMCKSHFKDYQWSRLATNNILTTGNHNHHNAA